MSVIERLDAQAVACDEEFAPALVPDGEGEHPAQVFDARRAILFVEMNNRFGVAMRAIDVTACFEFRAVIRVVVDFAVVGDVERRVFISHRLMSGSHINDAQAAVSKSHISINVETRIIRPAMRNTIAHPFEKAHVKRLR